jgi:hypothetical protein
MAKLTENEWAEKKGIKFRHVTLSSEIDTVNAPVSRHFEATLSTTSSGRFSFKEEKAIIMKTDRTKATFQIMRKRRN